MNQVDQIVEKALLFDFYGELLTNHQKEVYEEHVLNDLSVTEIAELLGISRQGVHDLIRRCDKILRDYENKLHLVEQFVRIEKMVETIHAGAMEMMDQDDPDLIRNNIRLIAETSEKLLEEF